MPVQYTISVYSTSNFEWQLPMAMVVAKSNDGYKCDYGMMADPIGVQNQIAPPLPHAGYGTGYNDLTFI